MVGQNLGAERPQRAAKMAWSIAGVGVAVTTVLSLPIFIWAEGCASLLTTDGAVLAETARYLRLNMLSEPFMAMSSVLGGSFQGAGDTRTTMRVIATSMWLIRLPLARVSGTGPGIWGPRCLDGDGHFHVLSGHDHGPGNSDGNDGKGFGCEQRLTVPQFAANRFAVSSPSCELFITSAAK